jgi:hypothetical protein
MPPSVMGCIDRTPGSTNALEDGILTDDPLGRNMRLSIMLPAAAILAAWSPTPTGAQRLTIRSSELRSVVDSTRASAFENLQRQAYQLTGGEGTPIMSLAAQAGRDPVLARELGALLERENVRIRNGRPLPEGYFDGYYVNVALTVARMKDPSMFRALLPSLALSDDVRVAVAGAGAAAVPTVIAMLTSDTSAVQRSAAARTLGKIATAAPVTALSRREIRDALFAALHHKTDFILRKVAVESLGSFDDPELRAYIATMAREDSATLPGAGGRRYPVRDAAKKWLASRGRQLAARFPRSPHYGFAQLDEHESAQTKESTEHPSASDQADCDGAGQHTCGSRNEPHD